MARDDDTARMRSRRAMDSSLATRARPASASTRRRRARCCFGARDATSDDDDATRDASEESRGASDASGDAVSATARARARCAATPSTSASADASRARRQSVDDALRASRGSRASGEAATGTADDGDDALDHGATEAELARFVRLNAKMLAKRRRATKSELEPLCEALSQTFTFSELDPRVRRRVASEMFFINVPEGTILMEENEPGDALYLVAGGEFDVLQNRLGADISVVTRTKGDIIGELALLVQRAALGDGAGEDAVAGLGVHATSLQEGGEAQRRGDDAREEFVPRTSSRAQRFADRHAEVVRGCLGDGLVRPVHGRYHRRRGVRR